MLCQSKQEQVAWSVGCRATSTWLIIPSPSLACHFAKGPTTAKHTSSQGCVTCNSTTKKLRREFHHHALLHPLRRHLQCVCSAKSEWEKLKLLPSPDMQLQLSQRKVRETDRRRRTGGSACARHCAVNTKGGEKKSGLIGSHSLRVSAAYLTGTAFNQTRPDGSTTNHM